MKEHYNFSDDQMKTLENKGITIADLYYLVPEFEANEAPVSKVSLYYYMDKHGDFTQQKSKGDIVANMIFESLPVQEKLRVGEYLDWLEGGEK